MDTTPDAANGLSDLRQLTPVDATPKTFAVNGMPDFPAYSATTAELLAKARANAANAAQNGGTPDENFKSTREQLMQSMVMSDKLPLPSPGSAVKRTRGKGRPRSSDARSTSRTATPGSERGRGKVGRPRGRGRGAGRGGKRKRSESVDSAGWNDTTDSDADRKAQKSDSDDPDAASYATPFPSMTKSGRSVNKPTQYVPVIPEPTSQPNKKKRPYRRNIEAAVCKMCHRGTSPSNNQIVFCDGCGTPYHQYCHDPPIENDVIEVQEKEWFCAECIKSREDTNSANAEGLVPGDGLTIDEKRHRLSTLPDTRLIELLLRASSIHPSLALFPSTAILVADTNTTAGASSLVAAPATLKPPGQTQDPLAIDVDADADVEPYDGYDTDPPAHYPKPGNGLARTLRPEAEDLEWLVDEDEEVFSHQVKLGDGINGGRDLNMGGT